jgi:hypothetical protein
VSNLPDGTEAADCEPRCRKCRIAYDIDSRPRGEQHHNSKLTDAQRRGIMAGILQTDPDVPAVMQKELADYFGVSVATISRPGPNANR